MDRFFEPLGVHDIGQICEKSNLLNNKVILTCFTQDENDSVELLNYNASEEFNKFKGKHVGSKGVDFSDRISHKSRTGYNVG